MEINNRTCSDLLRRATSVVSLALYTSVQLFLEKYLTCHRMPMRERRRERERETILEICLSLS
jgi:hypothetical protein